MNNNLRIVCSYIFWDYYFVIMLGMWEDQTFGSRELYPKINKVMLKERVEKVNNICFEGIRVLLYTNNCFVFFFSLLLII